MAPATQVWMFSGQGSQYYRMGVDLYEHDPVFRDTMDRCGDQVASGIGTSLTELIFQPRANRFEPFDRTLYTHAALFSIQFSLAQSMLHRGLRPEVLMGYSLGEWVAHVVAGILDRDTALDLLVEQARAVEAVSPPGGMLAVMAAPEILDTPSPAFRDTWIGARNFERHFVLTGSAEAIARAESELAVRNVTVQRLPVAYAFHSPLMDQFESPLTERLKTVHFGKPNCRLVSCRGVDVTGADPADSLWQALRQPIRFPLALDLTESAGQPTYIDCGPAGTMANFVKYNLSQEDKHRQRAIMSPFDRNVERLDALCATGDRTPS